MVDDAELLRRYSESGSEEAFTELAGRHLALVYFTALRRTGGNAALAQDIAQAVFSTMARKAGALSRHLALAGWLYTTTRHLAGKAVRKEQTRRRYEQDAAMHELTSAEPAQEWERLRPIIDDVLDALDEREREVILIRFFEGRPFTEIGATLRISQDAARMRVDRALEKVRHQLERRGIRSAAAALALALAAQGGLAVPASVVATVTSAAVAAGAASGGAAAWLGFMSATKINLGAASVIAVLATGIAIVERNRAHEAEARLAAITHEQSSLHARLARAEKGLFQAETRAGEAEKDSGALLAALEAARTRPALVPESRSAAGQPTTGDDPLTHSLNAIFPNGIVATVGDRTITVDDVRRELVPVLSKVQQQARDPDEFSQRLYKLQNSVITDLVNRILFIKEFHIPRENERAKHIPAEYVENAIADRMKDNFGNDQAKFFAHLGAQGMTPADYRKAVEEDIIYRYMLGQQRKLDNKATKAK